MMYAITIAIDAAASLSLTQEQTQDQDQGQNQGQGQDQDFARLSADLPREPLMPLCVNINRRLFYPDEIE